MTSACDFSGSPVPTCFPRLFATPGPFVQSTRNRASSRCPDHIVAVSVQATHNCPKIHCCKRAEKHCAIGCVPKQSLQKQLIGDLCSHCGRSETWDESLRRLNDSGAFENYCRRPIPTAFRSATDREWHCVGVTAGSGALNTSEQQGLAYPHCRQDPCCCPTP